MLKNNKIVKAALCLMAMVIAILGGYFGSPWLCMPAIVLISVAVMMDD